MSASVVVLIAYAVLGLLMASVREARKRGFFKGITRQTSVS